MLLVNSLPPKFRKPIKEFIKNLSKNLKDEFELYLFGSLARGDFLLNSDIDIIVVTNALKNIKSWEKTAYLRTLAPKNIGFDIICYTKKEFKKIQRLWSELIKIFP